MGSKSQHPGVEIHGDVVRVWFFWNGERCREPTSLRPTPSGLFGAAKLRAEIVGKINHGVFVYADYFPSSPRAEKGSTRTWEAVADGWLAGLENAKSTTSGYRKIVSSYWRARLGPKHIALITPGDIKKAIKDCGFKSPKTRNNALSVVKQVFEYAIGENYRKDNPAVRVLMLPVQRQEPDPFTHEEMARIIEWLGQHAPASVNYFRFAFATGLRTSELIDLRWPEIDMKARLARVDSAYVRREEKATKTYQVRNVDLTQAAVAALEAQKAKTMLAYGHLFLDPQTAAPYVGDKPPRLVFERALKALQIRHRPAYNTRHTFATLALMAGANPLWVSRQLGHASLTMTMKHYAKWIDGADRGRERDKLDAALGTLLGTQAGKTG